MRIAVIGGGAAGMMAATTINETNYEAEVFLLEKNNELGKKVIISGGGRCNVTTGIEDITEVLQKYPRGAKFLQSALRNFPPAEVREWFETHGVPMKCEEDMRVFPVSDNGNDILSVFKKIFLKNKTNLLLRHQVTGITKVEDEFIIEIKDQKPIRVDRVILALGGQAYRHTGSTGDGYALAENLGHHVTPLAPSLNSFITQEKWPNILSGVSFVKATISANGDKHESFTGPFLFTHTGISGPAVFALSSLVAFQNYGPKKALPITIDLLPESPSEKLINDIKMAMKQSPKKSFKNTIHAFVPLSVAEVICNLLKISLEKKNAEIGNQMINSVVVFIKKLPLSVIGRGAGSEFVTAGGIELGEVNPRTMESKLVPGLYFAGEILNVDGFTGGFNLQASWATGRLAGMNVVK